MQKEVPHQESMLKLENQLCFPLYACAKEMVKKYTPYLEQIDLTYTQYITMMVLWEHKSINAKELGKYLYLDSGTLTPLLKRLEAKQLIRRERSVDDERQLLVSITDEGEALKQQAAAVPMQVGSCINITHEETISLYQLLYKLLGQLSENSGE